VVAALNCRIPAVQRRIAIAPLGDADLWRVLISQVPPAGVVDSSATIKVERIRGLVNALNQVLDRMDELAGSDIDKQHQAVTQALMVWAYGRPGMRPRSAAARERMQQLADRYIDICLQYREAQAEVLRYAQTSQVTLRDRERPDWLSRIASAADAQRSSAELRDGYLTALTSDLLKHKDSVS
jgi:hypothetical protein